MYHAPNYLKTTEKIPVKFPSLLLIMYKCGQMWIISFKNFLILKNKYEKGVV